MAGQPVTNNPSLNQIVERFKLTQEEEAELMIRYTETVTRELVFAVDMMGFVMKERDLSLEHCPYICSFDCSGPTDFEDRMEPFVRLTIEHMAHVEGLRNNEEYLKQDHIGYVEFTGLAHALAITAELPSPLCPRFKTREFMLFCVLMAELCTTAYQEGMPKAPHLGIMFMCRTFSNLIEKSLLIAHPWYEMKYYARVVMQQVEGWEVNLQYE